MSLTKRQLINRISRETKEPREFVEEIVQRFLDAIVSELTAGNEVQLRGVGAFAVFDAAERTCIHPRTRKPQSIPPFRFIRFKPSRCLKRILNHHSLQEES